VSRSRIEPYKGTTYSVRWRDGDRKPRETFKVKAEALAYQSPETGAKP
jgi:hypothetical protein